VTVIYYSLQIAVEIFIQTAAEILYKIAIKVLYNLLFYVNSGIPEPEPEPELSGIRNFG
jgi:hypothetical protein